MGKLKKFVTEYPEAAAFAGIAAFAAIFSLGYYFGSKEGPYVNVLDPYAAGWHDGFDTKAEECKEQVLDIIETCGRESAFATMDMLEELHPGTSDELRNFLVANGTDIRTEFYKKPAVQTIIKMINGGDCNE